MDWMLEALGVRVRHQKMGRMEKRESGKDYMESFDEECTRYEMKTTLIKVIEYSGNNLRGVLYNPFFQSPQYFEGTSQCLFIIELVMDSLDSSKGEEMHLLHSSEHGENCRRVATPEERKAPSLANFNITVLFRQHDSWQGKLFWREKEMDKPFRSVLELIRLIDNCLSLCKHQ